MRLPRRLGDCEHKVSIVKVYELPNELPDSVVIGRLSHYGRVISFRRDRVADAIFNGVRTARMSIERPIPAQAFIAGEFCRFWYPSQPKTCRKCGADDHLAAACRWQRSERPGHRAEQCDQPALCRVCLSDGHETASCPFIFYNANVTGAKSAEKSYSGAAQSGKLVADARKAEEDHNRAKREEEERARREDRARKEKEKKQKEKERKEKERKERKEREERHRDRKEKERERRDRDRKEREREDREREDRRERDKPKYEKYSERRYKDDDDYRREERRDRDKDRYRSSRDRSSHRDNESGSESEEGWTRVSYRRDKGKSKSY